MPFCMRIVANLGNKILNYSNIQLEEVEVSGRDQKDPALRLFVLLPE